MAALVEGGEDVGDEVLLIIMRGYADVVRAEVRRERMLRRHEDERALPQTLQLQQIPGERLLLRNRAGTGQEIRADQLALGPDAAQQRDDPRAQRVKERVQLQDAAALFVVVQAGVIIGRQLTVA